MVMSLESSVTAKLENVGATIMDREILRQNELENVVYFVVENGMYPEINPDSPLKEIVEGFECVCLGQGQFPSQTLYRLKISNNEES